MTVSSRTILTIAGLTLTALGVLGVAAIMVQMEIYEASAKAVSETLKKMGTNNLLVLPGRAVNSGDGVITLTSADARAIAEECGPADVRAGRGLSGSPKAAWGARPR